MNNDNQDKKVHIIKDRHIGAAGQIIYQPRPRAETTELVPTRLQTPHGNQKFQPLPPPSGPPPYHLKLNDVLSAEHMDKIKNANGIIFHTTGDTGGIGYAVPQQIVEMHMENDFGSNNLRADPAFFYHLGKMWYIIMVKQIITLSNSIDLILTIPHLSLPYRVTMMATKII